jgi:predicted ATPase
MRIQRIILKNWKNFPKADIKLLERAFIIGANASGKSNLLDAFRFLRDIARGQGGGLQQALKNREGLSKVRCFAARSNPIVEIEVYLGEWEDVKPRFIYELGLTQETKGYRRPIVKFEKVTANEKLILDRPNDDDKVDPERLTETHLEQTSANKDFREIAAFFSNICYLHVVPQMIRTPEASMMPYLQDDPFGRSFLERLAKTTEKTREKRLKRIESALKIIVPQFTKLQFITDKKGQPHLEALYEHWRPNAGQQNEIQFSDGTLRAIGLLWMLQEGTSLLLIEEPELSLNSEIIKQLPGIFSKISKRNKRQIIISTHSHELLSDRGIGPEETIVLSSAAGEGTKVAEVSLNPTNIDLYQSGLTLAEIALPMISPKGAVQLSLQFDDNGNGSK